MQYTSCGGGALGDPAGATACPESICARAVLARFAGAAAPRRILFIKDGPGIDMPGPISF